jgi:SPP1 gp7 family putative phage head morphogenesis protein
VPAEIDLPALVKQSGVRRDNIVLRPINPTRVQATSLFRIYWAPLSVWADTGRLLTEYERSVAQIATDSPIDMEAIINAIAQAFVIVEIQSRRRLEEWASNLTLWHLQKFVASLKYATNVELGSVLGTGSSGQTLAEFLARNTALIRDVSDQTRGRISDIVFRNLPLRTPLRDVAKEISEATRLAKKRSLRIAMDQTQKLGAALDRDRQLQVGITKFVWKHSGKEHYRPHHLARDGKTFDWNGEVARTDPPGFAPFCGCKAMGSIK